MPAVFDPIRRPGLAYQHAFDWLAVELQCTAGPVVALAPAAFHAAELLRRLPALALLPPAPDGLEQVAAALGANPALLEPAPRTLAAIAWAEPEAGSAGQFEQVRAWLQPRGRLYLVTGGRLGRFLAERRAGQGGHLLDARDATALLRRHGFRIQQQVGLHGPRAIAWHSGGEMARRLGKPARRDRAHFAMRRDFVEASACRRAAALTLITAERQG